MHAVVDWLWCGEGLQLHDRIRGCILVMMDLTVGHEFHLRWTAVHFANRQIVLLLVLSTLLVGGGALGGRLVRLAEGLLVEERGQLFRVDMATA